MKAALTALPFAAQSSLTMAQKLPCSLPGFQVWYSQNEHSLIAADSNNSVIKKAEMCYIVLLHRRRASVSALTPQYISADTLQGTFMNNIKIGIRLSAAFGFMALLVIIMVLIGVLKINSLGSANDEISGSLYSKSSASQSLRYLTSDMSRLARNAILLRDDSQRERKPSVTTAARDMSLTVCSSCSGNR
ncbi:CHASE3 domain-containing protein [Pantoea stewartii]|nr:Tar ligand binding domain-containing protein [Pantoea stewartii]